MDWWRNAVIYQVYLRSFADSDGDGVGDICGLVSQLDYLQWLGVDAIWCSPLTASSNYDFGYDVTDYYRIDPALGTLATFDELLVECERRRIRVILDFVPNHTSSLHPWFLDPDLKREYYIWTDRPNNWTSSFRISSWTYDPDVGRYYLHSYLPEQPDLNWRSEGVRHEFDRIIRYWFDRGVAGLRIDACYVLFKDPHLRDNPAAGPGDHLWDRHRGQRPVHSAHQPGVHDVLRRWRRISDDYRPARVLMGATWVADPAELAAYYGSGDELHLPQNFTFPYAELDYDQIRPIAESWLAAIPAGGTPVWLASSHDLSRFPTRWCAGDERKIRLALTLLLTLPGVAVLYQGDELGLEDVEVPDPCLRDRVRPSRDRSRTPMPWTDDRNFGFTTGSPWLPTGDRRGRTVADQLEDPSSILHLTKNLIALKRRLNGAYEALPGPQQCWQYARGDVTVRLDFRSYAASVVEP